ncbi:unnamed protein product [Echinostoma caproni]|uniref:RIIa domain-containing protein n=1 Tax=Echinostoma caproni TaxID=27848 RepID=A0A183AZE3_9TREM|nr:unnamed protein product [Echinostoma caproni]
MNSSDHKHSIDSEALWAQIRAPEFMPEDPEAFLAVLESRFHEARITGQLSRYHKLLSAIPRDILINFRDFYMNILSTTRTTDGGGPVVTSPIINPEDECPNPATTA